MKLTFYFTLTVAAQRPKSSHNIHIVLRLQRETVLSDLPCLSIYLFSASEVWWRQQPAGQDIWRWPLPTGVLPRLGRDTIRTDLRSAGLQKVNYHFEFKLFRPQLCLITSMERPGSRSSGKYKNKTKHIGWAPLDRNLYHHSLSSVRPGSVFMKEWFSSFTFPDPLSNVGFYLQPVIYPLWSI